MPDDPILIPAEPRPVERRRAYGLGGIGPVSAGFIAVSVLVAIYSRLGVNMKALLPFFISDYRSGPVLFEVRQGEYWRLITPVFIHFGLIHLLFNMLWVKDLGTVIERRHGPGFLLGLSALLAVGSNLAQYAMSGPVFGGMSGVVYGWFAYVWIRGYFDPESGYRVPRQLVFWMLGWYLACLVGIIPHVANTAHGVGLALGAIVGLSSAMAARHSRLNRSVLQR